VKGSAVTTGLLELAVLLPGRPVSVKRVTSGAAVVLASETWPKDVSALDVAGGKMLADSMTVVVDVKILVSVLDTTKTLRTPTVV